MKIVYTYWFQDPASRVWREISRYWYATLMDEHLTDPRPAANPIRLAVRLEIVADPHGFWPGSGQLGGPDDAL